MGRIKISGMFFRKGENQNKQTTLTIHDASLPVSFLVQQIPVPVVSELQEGVHVGDEHVAGLQFLDASEELHRRPPDLLGWVEQRYCDWIEPALELRQVRQELKKSES